MKKKILFLIHAFNLGGAQKVLLNLVNAMDLNRYDITIKTVYKRHEMKAELAPGIKLTSINPFSSKRFSNLDTNKYSKRKNTTRHTKSKIPLIFQ